VDQRNPQRANPPAKVDSIARRLWVEGGPKASSRAEVWRGHPRRTWATECWVEEGEIGGESNRGMELIGRCVQGQVVGSPALGRNRME
jgi:hypothetical protein